MTPRNAALTLLLLLFCGATGGLAAWLGLPMPWMIGALIGSALAVIGLQTGPLAEYNFPMPLRTGFITLIGVMIGTQATPELLDQLQYLPLTLTALVVFILCAHAGNTLIFRRIGGFDRTTAFYSGTPGGLMESILLGESAGADIRLLTLQQFLRIIVVVTLVPAGLSLWIGHPVGSAAGALPGEPAQVRPAELLLVVIAAGVGLAMARLLRLPAGQITGPLVLTGALSLAGYIDLHVPFWMIATAQVVVGASLGLRFKGVTARMLRRSVGLSLLSVGFMLALGAGLASALHLASGLPVLVLLISFAPGGVTEMSIIALSLAASPALVSLHHVLRILLTVIELSLVHRFRPPQRAPRQP
ncbi:AbrB family transcriptional regulator [Marinovum sp.]|uniref:AbrB family transcriptional regulator n=1 Tax=Marinovum sp. TaxID=2024839 RepID=UPI002B265AC9|nr:AbrB family transcriptional regulator [Marinovum sp.]